MYKPDTLDFTPYRIVAGDQVEFLTKLASTQDLISTFGTQCGQMVDSIKDEQAATLQQADQAAQTATDKADESSSSAQQSKLYRDQAQQIAAGTVALTDLQPGTLSQPGDYPGVDGAGNVVARNVNTDTLAQAHAVALSF